METAQIIIVFLFLLATPALLCFGCFALWGVGGACIAGAACSFVAACLVANA